METFNKYASVYNRGGQPVRDQEPYFLLGYRKEPHHITKLATLSLNPASYETRFLLHDIPQGFYVKFQASYPHVQSTVRKSTPARLFHFRVAFSAITSTRASARTSTRTCVA